MADELREKAEGHWESILKELCVDPKILNGKHQPCPMCGGTDRFRFDNNKRRGDYYCSNCGPGDGFKLLIGVFNLDGFKDAAKMVEGVIGKAGKDKERSKSKPFRRLRSISRASVPVRAGDPVHKYLINRGLSRLPRTLRLHPALAYYNDGVKYGEYPAMVSLVRDNAGKSITYHVTYLTNDGFKAAVDAQKKVVSELGENGYHVELYPVNDIMGVAEGIETAIAARVLSGIPTWATINSNGMKDFLPPDGVTKVVVFADNDNNFTGQAAAYELARKLAAKKLEVNVMLPGEAGDWNDELVKRIRLQKKPGSSTI